MEDRVFLPGDQEDHLGILHQGQMCIQSLLAICPLSQRARSPALAPAEREKQDWRQKTWWGGADKEAQTPSPPAEFLILERQEP